MTAVPPTLPAFYNGEWCWMPYSFLRVCNDDAAALLLAYLLHEKEVAERDAGFPLDQFVPHDETKALTVLSTTLSTYKSKMTTLKRLGFVETKVVSKKQTVKIVLAKLQAAIG